MLEPAPIGTHADNFFAEPEFHIPADCAPQAHGAISAGTGTGKSTLLMNMAASDMAAGTGITVNDRTAASWKILLTTTFQGTGRICDSLRSEEQGASLAIKLLDCPRLEQRGLVVSHVVEHFHKLGRLLGSSPGGYLRNALWVLIEQASANVTPRASETSHGRGISHGSPASCRKPKANSTFLKHVRPLDAFIPGGKPFSPVLNKCRAFLTDPLMRSVIGTTRSISISDG